MMNNRLLSTAFVIFMLLTQSAIADESQYKIQPGDLLKISVWGEESLIADVPVRPDGYISFPLADDIPAAGQTVSALRNAVASKLTKYIPDPVVTVMTMELRGNTIYVIGKVIRPGPFQVQRQIDVVQALSMAGGMTPYAAANKINILRRGPDGSQTVIPFEYGDIEKGQNLEQNILLKPGDVVVVP